MFEQKEENYFCKYDSALKCFQNLESIFHREQICYSTVLQEINNCYNQINDIMELESRDQKFFSPLWQMRQHLLNLMEIIQSKIAMDNQCKNGLLHNEKQNKNYIFSQNKQKEEIIATVESTIQEPKISGLQEIAGLCDIKAELRSLLILPRTQPQLFQNRKISNSVLLFGPPGTGKTQLVHALVAEANAEFYCVSAGDVLSSMVGQSEKTLQTLFKHLIENNTLSVLFIDEIDSICRKRSTVEQEHCRRLKTEFMYQMTKIEDHKNIFVFCATNCPWDLDTAVLRRFNKRIFVPLPSRSERFELLKLRTRNDQLDYSSNSWSTFLDKTEGYSGSDLSDIIKHAFNLPLIELENTKKWKIGDNGLIEPVTNEEDINKLITCTLSELPPNSVGVRKVRIEDFITAATNIRLTVSAEEIKKFDMFNNM